MAGLLRWPARYVGALTLLGVFVSAPVLATGATWVGFSPAPGLIPHGGLRLEIGSRAYLITPNTGGVTSFRITKPVSVFRSTPTVATSQPMRSASRPSPGALDRPQRES
jgi:hypothetical protein